jgi:multicomponent Na+:H+ antiporter subunit D
MSLITNNSPVLIPLLFLSMGILTPVFALKKDGVARVVALLASFTAVVIAVYNVSRVIAAGMPIHYRLGNWVPPIGIEYVLDYLNAFVILVVNGIAFLVLIHAKKVIDRELPGKEVPYYATILLLLCGFNGILITGDLFNLYVFLEISSLSLYGLIAVGEKQAPVAAFRYLIMGTIAGCFYLLGVGFLYTQTGSLNMADTAAILQTMLDRPVVLMALGLMTLGMGIKMALFPLHGWLPDAYTYAPSTSSAIIAPTGTKVAAYVIIRIFYFVFGVTYVSHIVPFTQIVAWLAAAGIIYGSVMAIAQKELKRMLAYSSVAQVGYIGLGIGLANPLGLIGAVLHVLNHAFMKACLFLVAGNFRFKLGHSNIFKLDNSIRKKMPWTMAAFSVAALSMVGLPPMAGFFSKWYLALGTIEKAGSNWTGWIFLVVILVSSLLNAVYFFRILEKVYMKPMGKNSNNNHDHHEHPTDEETIEIESNEVGASMLIPTLIFAAGLIVLGLLNALIVKGIIAYIIPVGMK